MPSSPLPLAARLRERALALPWVRAVVEHEAIRLLVAGVCIGVLGGIAAWGFDLAMYWVGVLTLGTAEPAHDAPIWWHALLAPAVTGVFAGAIIAVGTSRQRPQSVPDVLVRARIDSPALTLRDALTSAAAAALVVGGGHSGGREGPIVQIASTLANEVCGLFRVPRRHFRALVASGAAAGVAASFNTPVGGAFFALEIILGEFGLETFAPVVAATVTGTIVGQALLGDRIALHLPAFELQAPELLLSYLLLGVLSGVLAVGLKRTVLWVPSRVERLGLPAPLRTGLAGLGVGAIAAAGMNEVMGNGYLWMEHAISDPSSVSVPFLALLVSAKLVATVLTTAGRGGAGLFSPSLYLGAIAGLLVGKLTALMWPAYAPSVGAFGMVGMAAVASGVLHAPITMTLMLFEMTGNYQVILPLMVAVAASGFVSRQLGSESLYHGELRRSGVSLKRRPTQLLNEELRVADVMVDDPVVVAPGDGLQAVAKAMLAGRVDEAFVVEGGRLVGTVQLAAVTERMFTGGAGVAADLATADLGSVTPDQPLGAAVPLFFHRRTNALPVVEAGGLVGVLHERDVVAAYHRAVDQQESMFARLSTTMPERPSSHVELPEGHVVEVVDVDGHLAGRTLAELALPLERRCMVIGHSGWDRRTGRWVRLQIDPKRALAEGDRLVLVGPADEISQLRAG